MCAWTVIVCAVEVPSPVLGWRRTSLSVGVGCGRFFSDQVILGPWTCQESRLAPPGQSMPVHQRGYLVHAGTGPLNSTCHLDRATSTDMFPQGCQSQSTTLPFQGSRTLNTICSPPHTDCILRGYRVRILPNPRTWSVMMARTSREVDTRNK